MLPFDNKVKKVMPGLLSEMEIRSENDKLEILVNILLTTSSPILFGG